MTHPHSSRWRARLAAAVVGTGLLGEVAPAQFPATSDPIAAARARRALADQKAQADVLNAIREAEQQAKTSPVKAAILLKQAQDSIDLSAALSGETRAALVGQLQAKLANIDSRSAPNTQIRFDPKMQAVQAAKEAALADAKKEAAVVSKALGEIARDQASNRPAEAAAKVATLQKAYPNNPAVLFVGGQEGFAHHLAEAQELARQQDKRVVLAMNDVQRSALPSLGDIEFPKDWKPKTLRRMQQVELSAKEKAIIESLNAPMTLLARDRPFEELIQEMSNSMNQNILVDPKSLQDAGLDLKKPVSVSGKDISAKTFLRQILAGQGLTFVVQDEVIKVVTVEKAREMLVTKVYYLGDIVQGTGAFSGALRWGALVDYEQTMINVQVVIDSIVNSIDPQSWKEKGGPGSVTFHFASMSLVVRASSEVHATLSSKLGKGR